jgi:hypothetical protein
MIWWGLKTRSAYVSAPQGAAVCSSAQVIRTSLKSDSKAPRFLLKEGRITVVSSNIEAWVVSLFRGIGMALRYTFAAINANTWIAAEDQFRWHCLVRSPNGGRKPLNFVHHVAMYSLSLLADRHGQSDWWSSWIRPYSHGSIKSGNGRTRNLTDRVAMDFQAYILLPSAEGTVPRACGPSLL